MRCILIMVRQFTQQRDHTPAWKILIAGGAIMITTQLYYSSHVTNQLYWELVWKSSDDNHISNSPKQNYALANFVDADEHIYGVYSIHKQLIKHSMLLPHSMDRSGDDGGGGKGGSNREGLTHVVVLNEELDSKFHDVLAAWVGEENVRVVHKTDVIGKLNPEQGMWVGTFNKLFFFNLTEFDKVIMMDTDVLIRSNIMHWFNYDTPCGVDVDNISWNSGTLLISPNAEVFGEMLHDLPLVQRWESKHSYEKDPLVNGYSDQDFITSFFLRNASKTKSTRKRCILPPEAAPLIGAIEHNYFFQYFNEYHPDIYQTVHFADTKPYRGGTMSFHPFKCSLVQEWNESMRGIDQYYDQISPLNLAQCHNNTSD